MYACNIGTFFKEIDYQGNTVCDKNLFTYMLPV